MIELFPTPAPLTWLRVAVALFAILFPGWLLLQMSSSLKAALHNDRLLTTLTAFLLGFIALALVSTTLVLTIGLNIFTLAVSYFALYGAILWLKHREA